MSKSEKTMWVEVHQGPDSLGRLFYTLYWLDNYSPTFHDGWHVRGQCYRAVPPDNVKWRDFDAEEVAQALAKAVKSSATGLAQPRRTAGFTREHFVLMERAAEILGTTWPAR